MSFDPLVSHPGRLQILTALVVRERQAFVHLRAATRLTDGNLAAHAKRLQSGGLIAVDKQFCDGKPVTHITLTPAGREALESHVRRLVSAMSPQHPEEESPVAAPTSEMEDEWVD